MAPSAPTRPAVIPRLSLPILLLIPVLSFILSPLGKALTAKSPAMHFIFFIWTLDAGFWLSGVV